MSTEYAAGWARAERESAAMAQWNTDEDTRRKVQEAGKRRNRRHIAAGTMTTEEARGYAEFVRLERKTRKHAS